MKKKLSVVTVSLIVSVLATCILGGKFNEKVFAAETKSEAVVSQYNQLEMPIIAIDSDSEISSDEEYTDVQITVINDEGNYEMTKMDTRIRLRGNSSLHASPQISPAFCVRA